VSWKKIPVNSFRGWSVAFSPNNQLLALGGIELVIWDAYLKNALFTPLNPNPTNEFDNYRYPLAFSPDGKYLVVSMPWGTIAFLGVS
jgi:WD40 repeat protein